MLRGQLLWWWWRQVAGLKLGSCCMAWGFGLRMTIWIFGPYERGLRFFTGLNAVDVFRYQIEGLGSTLLIDIVV